MICEAGVRPPWPRSALNSGVAVKKRAELRRVEEGRPGECPGVNSTRAANHRESTSPSESSRSAPVRMRSFPHAPRPGEQVGARTSPERGLVDVVVVAGGCHHGHHPPKPTANSMRSRRARRRRDHSFSSPTIRRCCHLPVHRRGGGTRGDDVVDRPTASQDPHGRRTSPCCICETKLDVGEEIRSLTTAPATDGLQVQVDEHGSRGWAAVAVQDTSWRHRDRRRLEGARRLLRRRARRGRRCGQVPRVEAA